MIRRTAAAGTGSAPARRIASARGSSPTTTTTTWSRSTSKPRPTAPRRSHLRIAVPYLHGPLQDGGVLGVDPLEEHHVGHLGVEREGDAPEVPRKPDHGLADLKKITLISRSNNFLPYLTYSTLFLRIRRSPTPAPSFYFPALDPPSLTHQHATPGETLGKTCFLSPPSPF